MYDKIVSTLPKVLIAEAMAAISVFIRKTDNIKLLKYVGQVGRCRNDNDDV